MPFERPEKKPFCADYSRAAGEQLAGSAKRVDLWLLLEFRSRWEHEAAAVFTEPVQLRLKAIRSKFPKSRLALVKQPERTQGPLSMFWAFSREREPHLYRTEFGDYDELSFDLDKMESQTVQRFFGVCTHGTHDLCCAQFGNKIYAEMRALHENVWQVSHIGGCRFAPNVVCLPDGVIYGRLEAGDGTRVVDSYQQASLFLPNVRGRSCYSKPVQAAEHFLRTAKNLRRLDELSLASVAEPRPGQWLVTFTLSETHKQFQVSLYQEAASASTFKSCAATELSPRETFRLADVRGV